MKTIRNRLSEIHSGYGGIFFMIVNFLCSVIMFYILRLSWDSQVIAISDNLAYIASVNTTVFNYTANKDSYVATNPSIYVRSDGTLYQPLADFNNMIHSVGIATSSCSQCTVVWDKSKGQTKLQFSSFDTILSTRVTPHQTDTVIEQY